MDIREFMAGARPLDDELKNRTVQLIAQRDRRKKQKGSDSAMTAAFHQHQNPEYANEDQGDWLFVQVSQKRKEYIEEPISQSLIAEVKQIPVQIHEDLGH
jgi:hypothetical protein